MAEECDPATCTLENKCKCADTSIPGSLNKAETPKIVVVSMDDGFAFAEYSAMSDVCFKYKYSAKKSPFLIFFFFLSY